MPYTWISQTTPGSPDQELHLWPHQSLRPQGYVKFLGATAVLISLPLLPVLGSVVLWGLLPFLLLALFGMKWALDRNRQDSQILEVLKLDEKNVALNRYGPRNAHQSWHCNRYWATVHLHPIAGTVPNYVTLRGGGREVEIGTFLSEEERKMLYEELARIFDHGID